MLRYVRRATLTLAVAFASGDGGLAKHPAACHGGACARAATSGLSMLQSRRASVLRSKVEVEDVDYEDEPDNIDELDESDPSTGPALLEGSQGRCEKECAASVRYSPLSAADGADGKQILYYTSPENPNVFDMKPAKKAFLVFHGVGHNPGTYFCYVQNALNMSGASLSDNYVIAVGLLDWYTVAGDSKRRRRRHMKKNNPVNWAHKHSWMYGKKNGEAYSSFEVVDVIVRGLMDRNKNPNLREIALVGHGGGAQFVQRYAVLSDVQPVDGMKVTYIVANPSTFLYLTPHRPVLVDTTKALEQGGCSQYAAKTYSAGTFSFDVPSPDNFLLRDMYKHGGKEYDYDKCRAYDEYEYGFADAPAYFPDAASLQERFKTRHVLYLAAHFDACNFPLQEELMNKNTNIRCGYCCNVPQPEAPANGTCEYNAHEIKYPLITKCQAMMQGYTRVQRAWAYRDYIAFLYGDDHSQIFHAVDGQHSSCEIFQSKEGQAILFGDGITSTTDDHDRTTIATTTTTTTTTMEGTLDVNGNVTLEHARKSMAKALAHQRDAEHRADLRLAESQEARMDADEAAEDFASEQHLVNVLEGKIGNDVDSDDEGSDEPDYE